MSNNLEASIIKDEILPGLNKAELYNNPIFLYLQSELEKNLKSSKRKSYLYVNLHRLLTEVAFTSDSSLQNAFLKKIKAWYDSKIYPNKIETVIISSPNPKPIYIPLNNSKKSITPVRSPYIPKKYKEDINKTHIKVERKDSKISNESVNERPSTSEPYKNDKQGRAYSQSPSIIRSVIINFVKNKRVKMYNFTMNKFLEESRNNKINQNEKSSKNNRPMSSTMRKQIEEVEAVKQRLANRKISCEVSSLFNGIVIDDNIREDKIALPRGGELLLKSRNR